MIDHNERAAEARAIRQAVADARAMHDPVNPDCEAWAAWLEARAARIEQASISGATPPDSPEANARAQAAGQTIALASVQPPTREQIESAVGAVLFNASNYPPAVVAYIFGQDIGPLRAKVTDAVLALFPQPTPSAEPPSIVKGMRVRYLDGGDERIVGEFVDGAWDLLIPGTEKSRMCVEPDVFWQTVELVAVEPVSIADMAPGTTFRAQAYAQAYQMWRVVDAATVEHQSGFRHHVSVIDPSTIREVTPPPATPEEGNR